SSFGDALLACHASVYRYARGLCHDAAEAEELTQETFRRALSAKRRPISLTIESVRPWMFTILRNHWHNEIRERRRDADLDPVGAMASDDTPETIVYRRFLQSEVRDALDALPPLFREVIVLREIEGLSYSEMATLLNCPLGTVMSRLARARTVLRSMFVGLMPDAAEKAAHR
ncbi:MAG TPA: sigma-70 family RNA polymerase sigma factor, partial [Bryobacteraceae bacterium]